MRVLPRFPARITATDGLTVVRDGTDVVVKQDFGSLIRIPSVDDPDKAFFIAWNSDEDLYSIMSFTDTFAAVIDTTGLMAEAVYDPQNIHADAFDRANHTGTQAQSTVVNLVSDLALKAPLASPALTGNPTAPTQAALNNSTRLATTAYVDAADAVVLAAAIANQKWRSRFIGEVVFSNTAITGAEIPPSSTADTVWIELTMGLTGVGAFNNGKVTSETVSGSAPLVSATVVINFGASPMNGQTVRLINTESRILRPSSSAGTLQDDAFQDHAHGVVGSDGSGGGVAILNGAAGGFSPNNKTANAATAATGGTPRIANETRMKNIGVKAYMRIA